MAGPEEAKNRARQMPPPDSDPFGDASLKKIPVICQPIRHKLGSFFTKKRGQLFRLGASTLRLGSVGCDIVYGKADHFRRYT